MPTMSGAKLEQSINEFKKRLETEQEFCEELFVNSEIRVLAAKYAYYVKSNPFWEDYVYDGYETSWYIMGRGLGYLEEDETSPCVDFNENHSYAKEAIELAEKLMRKPKVKK